MTAVLMVVIIVALSLVLTKIATIALVHTGLSQESAQFQARSALSGVGFTTNESEAIVNHPVRRRIIMLLMLMGNAQIVVVISSLILTFVGPGNKLPLPARLGMLAGGLALLWAISSSKVVNRWLSKWITAALKRWSTIEVRDYASLLHLSDNHQILELNVKQGDWLAAKTLAELALSDEGVMVIGIRRQDGSYVGAPHGATRIEAGDLVVLYGRDSILKDLDARRSDAHGEEAHRKAVREQTRIFRKQMVDETARMTQIRMRPE